MDTLSARSLAALMCADPATKIAATRRLHADRQAGALASEQPAAAAAPPIPVPGRPERPLLVAPRELKSRGLGSAIGRASLLHAVAHIEFNAINLALDAVYRFPGMPEAFYADWLQVAVDEARHFDMLANRLRVIGHHYGEFPAHNGLWAAACSTAHSCLARMALVPRVLEARGLDVSPGMIERLRRAGDHDSAALIEIILHEEIAHVAAGTRWFNYCCQQQQLDPDTTFLALVREHAAGILRPPFNHSARRAAGFSEAEQLGLQQLLAEAPSPKPPK
ncbi:MAG: ferritin-like domain-containing protein [Lysobacterales bacterium]